MAPQGPTDTGVRAEAAPERVNNAPQASTIRPQDAVKSPLQPEEAKTASVRNMKFEVSGGDRRVEVRLSDRGGEVKLTVRTPDAPLAGALRENLPALSARLAENGLKNETWHPAATATEEWRHSGQTATGNASQDANSQPRQHDQNPQQEAGQRQPSSPQEVATKKEKGKDFAWLMSSLR
jgi:hypothetical protein